MDFKFHQAFLDWLFSFFGKPDPTEEQFNEFLEKYNSGGEPPSPNDDPGQISPY